MSIRIRDDARLFAPADMSALESAATHWPFEVHLLTSTAYASRTELEAGVDKDIDAPNVVAVGIDPTHRWVAVHYGIATKIRESAWSTIVTSGHEDFRAARWSDGVVKVGDAAKTAYEQSRSSTVAAEHAASADASHYSVIGVALAFVVPLLLVVFGLRWALKRQRRLAFDAPVGAGPYRTASPPAPAIYPPTAGTKASPTAPLRLVPQAPPYTPDTSTWTSSTGGFSGGGGDFSGGGGFSSGGSSSSF